MSSAKAFLKKVVRVRSYLISSGKSIKTDEKTLRALRKTKMWLDAFPKITEDQARRYIKRNIDQVNLILPGKGSTQSEAFQNQLNEITHA